MQKRPRISKEFTYKIAEREYELLLNTERRSIVLRIGSPVQDVETVGGMDWRCPVQLIGTDNKALPPGVGVDSLQAHLHAIKVARIELEALERETGGQIQWLDQLGYDLPLI